MQNAQSFGDIIVYFLLFRLLIRSKCVPYLLYVIKKITHDLQILIEELNEIYL